jgi:hypothetical protein
MELKFHFGHFYGGSMNSFIKSKHEPVCSARTVARLICLCLLLSVLVSRGATPPEPKSAESKSTEPKSAAAIALSSKYTAAVSKAEAAYRTALIAADKQLISDSEASTRRAIKAADLDVANECNELKRAAEARLVDAKAPVLNDALPLIKAEYGGSEKWIDVTAGVVDRLSKGADVWVDQNITDGREKIGGDLRLVLRLAAGKPLVIMCRQSSRIFLMR